MELIDKLKEIEASYRELEKKMADPEIVNDPHEMQQLGKKPAARQKARRADADSRRFLRVREGA